MPLSNNRTARAATLKMPRAAENALRTDPPSSDARTGGASALIRFIGKAIAVQLALRSRAQRRPRPSL